MSMLMGIPTLLATNTHASDVSESQFESSIDGTYDHYMFIFTDIHPVSAARLLARVSTNGGSSYGVEKTSIFWLAHQREDAADATEEYRTDRDMAGSTDEQTIGYSLSADNDSSLGGELHLFHPANTTYSKQWTSHCSSMMASSPNYAVQSSSGGYINNTAAVVAVSFEGSAGNIDSGVIQMYGIA